MPAAHPARPRTLLACLLALVALAAVAAAPGAAQRANPDEEDPALVQRIDAGQEIAEDRATLSEGHVDVGPRFVDGRWTLMIHDDAARAGGGASVWRHAERTVLRVSDAARLTVPDDPLYRFLHSEPGSRVHVVPQTQDPDVVWVGWNTQDPEVMDRLDRGVTMTLTGVEGPGDLVVYLQSGSFSDPEVLWDSAAPPNPVWVDVNTHTHANWVFSKPGVYLVRVRIDADLLDGIAVSDTRELRFAVGSNTRAADAMTAEWTAGPVDDAVVGDDVGDPPSEGGDGDGGIAAWAALLLALGAAALAGAFAYVIVRGNRAKRRARQDDADRGEEPPDAGAGS